jgi:hypothetical protein
MPCLVIRHALFPQARELHVESKETGAGNLIFNKGGYVPRPSYSNPLLTQNQHAGTNEAGAEYGLGVDPSFEFSQHRYVFGLCCWRQYGIAYGSADLKWGLVWAAALRQRVPLAAS